MSEESENFEFSFNVQSRHGESIEDEGEAAEGERKCVLWREERWEII